MRTCVWRITDFRHKSTIRHIQLRRAYDADSAPRPRAGIDAGQPYGPALLEQPRPLRRLLAAQRRRMFVHALRLAQGRAAARRRERIYPKAIESYFAPTTVDEALRLLAENRDSAKLLARRSESDADALSCGWWSPRLPDRSQPYPGHMADAAADDSG
jgi:hypothetical protein